MECLNDTFSKMRRRLPLVFKTACVVVVALFIFSGYIYSRNSSVYAEGFSSILPFDSVHENNAAMNAEKTPLVAQPAIRENLTLFELAPSYIHAILHPEDTTFPRLDCPAPTPKRYEYLRTPAVQTERSTKQLKYFFALNLHQCASLLPRLIGSVVETIRFLGPHNCALSIVEGRSDDGTFEVLKLLSSAMEGMGTKYFFASSALDPNAPTNDRIKALAELRNQALESLFKSPDQYSSEATVIFLNDVSICSQDILELIHQRRYQQADMTCGMDWTYVGQDPTFYDVWIARGMTGDTFFNIPEDGNWNSAWNLFWNDAKTKSRLSGIRPFQVFSCWNGATAFTANPILEKSVRFRSPFEKECYGGEPILFCKDMWHHGYGRIAVVPSVNIEYSDDGARKIKALKGYASDLVKFDSEDTEMRIEWDQDPPPNVKCMPSFTEQSWRAWNEAL